MYGGALSGVHSLLDVVLNLPHGVLMQSAEVGDINEDGFADIWVAEWNGYLVYGGQLGGQTDNVDVVIETEQNGNIVRSMVAGDVDGDEQIDLSIGDSLQGAAYLVFGTALR